MKLKFLGVISVFIFIGLLISFNYDLEFTPSGPGNSKPCGEPLTYRIGDIDSRFDITEQQLSEIMKEVEELWTKPLDRNLLEYDPNGKVTISLIYSEEQQRTEEEQRFAKRLKTMQVRVETYQQEYEQLAEKYKEREKDFKDELAKYNSLAESYNDLAEKWSGQNLSDNQLDKINKLERRIKEHKSVINRKQENLESLRQRTNAKSKQLNKLIDDQNELIDTYNARFGGSMQFDQGHFVKKGNDESIRIYQFANQSELKAVLAHETGHALGLGHVGNPESIMYHMMGKQNIFDLKLTQEDIAAIKKRCNQ